MGAQSPQGLRLQLLEGQGAVALTQVTPRLPRCLSQCCWGEISTRSQPSLLRMTLTRVRDAWLGLALGLGLGSGCWFG